VLNDPDAVINSVPPEFDSVAKLAPETTGVPLPTESRSAPFAAGAALGSVMPQLAEIVAFGACRKTSPALLMQGSGANGAAAPHVGSGTPALRMSVPAPEPFAKKAWPLTNPAAAIPPVVLVALGVLVGVPFIPKS